MSQTSKGIYFAQFACDPPCMEPPRLIVAELSDVLCSTLHDLWHLLIFFQVCPFQSAAPHDVILESQLGRVLPHSQHKTQCFLLDESDYKRISLGLQSIIPKGTYYEGKQDREYQSL